MNTLFKQVLPALCAALCVALLAGPVRAVISIDQASPKAQLPAGHPAIGPNSPMVNPQAIPLKMQTTAEIQSQDRTAFKKTINLSGFRLLAVYNKDEVKTLDSWARESLHTICHYGSINGSDSLYTVLDMALRPEAWTNRNFIYIMAIPIRKGLEQFVAGKKEQKRLLEQGTVSPEFLAQPQVEKYLQNIASQSVLNSSVAQISNAMGTFQDLGNELLIVPPAPPAKAGDWHEPLDLAANLGRIPKDAPPGIANLKPVPGYTQAQASSIFLATARFVQAWRNNDAAAANRYIAQLTKLLPAANPAAYPSSFRRHVEIWYNRLFNGTIVGVFLYFVSLTLFLIAAVGAYPAARKPAMVFFTLAVLVHALFMATRWWLAGRIPIQNEFESVLGSAFAGCVIGWCLEVWKRNNLFGLAMSFVGFLAMTACFVVPFVLGKSIGANISRVDGVLNTYWLYIHVNVVISSYALIAASFCLGVLYLITKAYYNLHPVEAFVVTGSGGAGAAALAGGGSTAIAATRGGGTAITPERRKFLDQLDSANIVILQMAFWFLGTGIIFGAIWADFSWGRPWGWDPKETFALLTWIFYLIIVHLRFVTPKYRPDWTAWLSIAGFAAMMFNWIGVNFFLVGLHSYA